MDSRRKVQRNCRKGVGSAHVSPDSQIQNRIMNCQTHLQRWNRDVFGNVNKMLKQKQERLKQLETLNLLHETAKEKELRKEINECLTREEVMWN